MWYLILFLLLFSILIYSSNKKEWIIKKSYFPYPEGYCTYNIKTKTILDTGLSKEYAKQICKELNNKIK